MYINLGWNKLDNTMAAGLCEILAKNQDIEKLLLHHNKLGPDGIEIIA